MVFGKCVQCVKRSRCESGLSVEEASARSKWKKLSVDGAKKKKTTKYDTAYESKQQYITSHWNLYAKDHKHLFFNSSIHCFFHETYNYKHVRLIIEPKEVLKENSSSGVLSAVIN